jgi:hypothetical protein
MKTLSPAQHIAEFCEKHDLTEYSLQILVTMPNGFQFITDSTRVANKMISEHQAQTKHITELGA